MSVRWQHCIDHADKYSKADRQSVKRDYMLACLLTVNTTAEITKPVDIYTFNTGRLCLAFTPTAGDDKRRTTRMKTCRVQ